MTPQKLGRLSSDALVRLAEGLFLSTKHEPLDVEAQRRLRAVRRAVAPLARERRDATVARDRGPSVRDIDAVIDVRWSVLRNVLRELARMADTLALGKEAASALRTHFPDGLAFLDLPAQLQLRHGHALLRALDAAPFSAELSAIVQPVIAEIRRHHAEYERVLDAKIVHVDGKPSLVALRAPASAALEAFIAYVGVMATGGRATERAHRILAPLLNAPIRSKARTNKPRSKPAARLVERAEPERADRANVSPEPAHAPPRASNAGSDAADGPRASSGRTRRRASYGSQLGESPR